MAAGGCDSDRENKRTNEMIATDRAGKAAEFFIQAPQPLYFLAKIPPIF